MDGGRSGAGWPRLLGHVRVLDLSRMYPGAYCTSVLADLGADIVKVETPGTGDGIRARGDGFVTSGHAALNRGKRSITLNLRDEGAGAVLRRLVTWTDVVVESARPGQMEAMGLGFDDLRAENPRLVWCSITGFGPDGPNAQAPGHDLSFLAVSGLLSGLAVDGVPPVPSVPVSLPSAGLMAATGILAALSNRDQTGAGRRIDVSIVDTAVWSAAEQVTAVANRRDERWGTVACRNNYRCADDRWISCTASEPKSWAVLIEALGLPQLADYRYGTNEAETTRLLVEAFASKPQAHWAEHPGAMGGLTPILDFGDLPADPQVVHRQGIAALDGNGLLAATSPLRIDGAVQGSHGVGMSSPPALGADDDDVLSAAGFAPDEITALRANGTI